MNLAIRLYVMSPLFSHLPTPAGSDKDFFLYFLLEVQLHSFTVTNRKNFVITSIKRGCKDSTYQLPLGFTFCEQSVFIKKKKKIER